MRKWLGFILVLGLLVFPSAVNAQDEAKLESLNIELWSEYDQPSMLVINEFVVTQNTALPVKVTVRFPKEGNLMAVAVEQDSNLFNVDFDGPEEQGNWQNITLNVDTYDKYRIEYYQPLTRAGNKRSFKYQWFGEYAVDKFSVNMLIPADSTNIVATPILSDTSISQNKLFLLGSVTENGLRAGQSYEFQLVYARESDAVINTGQSDSVQPSEPIGPDTSGRVSIDRMPYIIGGVGLALIAVALFFYWRSTRSEGFSSTRSGSRKRHHQRSEEVGEDQAYCHECGARAHLGDRFCRTCGSRLRTGQ